MSVKAAREINPDLDLVGGLQVGDVLLQAVSGPPFSYVEVPIESITRMLARDAKTQTVYSLHLDVANPGYHANGFLVAVNYPTLREDHFVKAFANTTAAEREYLRSHFKALAPFLRRGLGGYISEILRRALDDDAAYGTPQTGIVTHN